MVRADNDASLGALAENVYLHPETETLLYVKWSSGVGSGIVISGNIFRGASGAAGELGHMRVRNQGAYCLYGGRGCVETLVGADTLLANATAVLGNQKQNPPANLEQLIDKADAGDPLCVRVIQDAARELGRAIGMVCNVLNPNVVVLGGTLAQAADEVGVLATGHRTPRPTRHRTSSPSGARSCDCVRPPNSGSEAPTSPARAATPYWAPHLPISPTSIPPTASEHSPAAAPQKPDSAMPRPPHSSAEPQRQPGQPSKARSGAWRGP